MFKYKEAPLYPVGAKTIFPPSKCLSGFVVLGTVVEILVGICACINEKGSDNHSQVDWPNSRCTWGDSHKKQTCKNNYFEELLTITIDTVKPLIEHHFQLNVTSMWQPLKEKGWKIEHHPLFEHHLHLTATLTIVDLYEPIILSDQ